MAYFYIHFVKKVDKHIGNYDNLLLIRFLNSKMEEENIKTFCDHSN